MLACTYCSLRDPRRMGRNKTTAVQPGACRMLLRFFQLLPATKHTRTSYDTQLWPSIGIIANKVDVSYIRIGSNNTRLSSILEPKEGMKPFFFLLSVFILYKLLLPRDIPFSPAISCTCWVHSTYLTPRNDLWNAVFVVTNEVKKESLYYIGQAHFQMNPPYWVLSFYSRTCIWGNRYST